MLELATALQRTFNGTEDLTVHALRELLGRFRQGSPVSAASGECWETTSGSRRPWLAHPEWFPMEIGRGGPLTVTELTSDNVEDFNT